MEIDFSDCWGNYLGKHHYSTFGDIFKMNFNPKNWKYFKLNRGLKEQVDNYVQEHIEFLKKMQELNETNEMIRKLARTQATEIKDLSERLSRAEATAKEAQDEIVLLKKGITTHPGEIKAIGIVKVNKGSVDANDTYSPLIITLNENGTEVIKKELRPDTPLNFAIDQAKIEFIQLFDPIEMN